MGIPDMPTRGQTVSQGHNVAKIDAMVSNRLPGKEPIRTTLPTHPCKWSARIYYLVVDGGGHNDIHVLDCSTMMDDA